MLLLSWESNLLTSSLHLLLIRFKSVLSYSLSIFQPCSSPRFFLFMFSCFALCSWFSPGPGSSVAQLLHVSPVCRTEQEVFPVFSVRIVIQHFGRDSLLTLFGLSLWTLSWRRGNFPTGLLRRYAVPRFSGLITS